LGRAGPPDVSRLLGVSGLALLGLVVGTLRAHGDPPNDWDDPVDLLETWTPSEAVYPPHTLAVEFDHAAHAAQFDCQSCHAAVATSAHVADDLLPSMEDCGRCHPQAADTEDPDACRSCHADYRPVWPEGDGFLAVRDPRFPLVGPEPVVRFQPNLIFSHVGHTAWTCDHCHPSQTDGGAALPSMADCTDCHRRERAQVACQTCHPSGDDGRLVTHFPGNRQRSELALRPRDHDESWAESHGLAAATAADACLTCHAERTCLGCHDGALATDAIHPVGFRTNHAWAARRIDSDCTSCHVASGFCLDCHTDAQMVATPPHRPPLGARIHPEGWVEFDGGEHGRAAARNMVECASCHQESSCAACHQQVSPHGPHFLERCRSLYSANPRVCGRCHSAAELEQLGSRCR
jgi:hypothetical protein